jgi:hypothetical protein
MLQPQTSRYKQMESEWLALAEQAHSCLTLIHKILDNQAEWLNTRRHHHAQIDGKQFDLTEVQIHLDMLVENVTHLTVQVPRGENEEERIHVAFFAGKRIFVEVNNRTVLDQGPLEEVSPEILIDTRERLETIYPLLERIAPIGYTPVGFTRE